MSNNSPIDCSKLILPNLDRIARETGLIIRKSPKFSADGFLSTILAAVANGMASFNQLASQLSDRVALSMAPQSLHERVDERSTAFLLRVIEELSKQRYSPATDLLKGSIIKRVIVEDSSGVRFPKSNASNFPAHGNHHGETAGAKVNLAYDLITGAMVAHTLEGATTQDKTIGSETLAHVKEGSLVLRDMGYFKLSELSVIEIMRAYWLTRLPLTTGVILENGEKLESLLRGKKHEIIDTWVSVGEDGKKCRLIAVRARPEVAKKKRAERREKAKKSGKKACPKGLTRDGWHIMLTNLTAEQSSLKALVELYRARWAIEIQFRAWKQALNFDSALNRKSNKHHMEALLLGAMIAHHLGLKIGAIIGEQIGLFRLSYEKLYDLLSICLVSLPSFAHLLEFSPSRRYISRNKRTATSPIESGILALT